MSSMTSWRPLERDRSTSAGEELLSDYRQRKAFEESERAEKKRMDCAEQYSSLNSADLRIRAWEKVHHLRMPSDPRHPALAAIASATQLTLEDVLNEQRLRSARRASAGA
jgi:hypothetical protein